ncbi:MAG: hypothetical protein K6U00_05760 [Armatimonadetes bacterium]|nr:hypothetical protein [Armatimonadota bacterium]
MRFAIAAIITTLVLTSVKPTPIGDPTVEKALDGNGWINWNRQVVKAIGCGMLPGDLADESQAIDVAHSAATLDARRNLMFAARTIRITGNVYLKDVLTKSEAAQQRLNRMIGEAAVVSERQLADRSFEVIMQLPLIGETGIISLIEERFSTKTISKYRETVSDSPTGVIVDARGLDIKLGMTPQISDEHGTNVYGAHTACREYAIQRGIVAYYPTMEQALKSPRSGCHPLVVKALKKDTRSDTDIIIRDRDAVRIKTANEATNILDQCNVSIVISFTSKYSKDSSETKGVRR